MDTSSTLNLQDDKITCKVLDTEEPPMVNSSTGPANDIQPETKISPSEKQPKKRKKSKKQSYKDLMSSMMQSKQSEEESQEQHRRKILSCTGGGSFQRGNLDKL